MQVFTGDILEKLNLNEWENIRLHRFVEDMFKDATKKVNRINELSNYIYGKIGTLHEYSDYYVTDAHVLSDKESNKLVAVCLMTDFYEDVLVPAPKFDLDKWIDIVDANKGKSIICFFDGNMGVGFDTIMTDDGNKVDLFLNEHHIKDPNGKEKAKTNFFLARVLGKSIYSRINFLDKSKLELEESNNEGVVKEATSSDIQKLVHNGSILSGFLKENYLEPMLAAEAKAREEIKLKEKNIHQMKQDLLAGNYDAIADVLARDNEDARKTVLDLLANDSVASIILNFDTLCYMYKELGIEGATFCRLKELCHDDIEFMKTVIYNVRYCGAGNGWKPEEHEINAVTVEDLRHHLADNENFDPQKFIPYYFMEHEFKMKRRLDRIKLSGALEKDTQKIVEALEIIEVPVEVLKFEKPRRGM